MSEAMYDLLYIIDSLVKIVTMVVIIITCYCYTKNDTTTNIIERIK